MKLAFLGLMLVASLSALASDSMVFNVECSNKNSAFEIYIPEAYTSFQKDLHKGLNLTIQEGTQATNAIITSIKGPKIIIKLEDGRTLNFNQYGGNRIKLGDQLYMCSNAIGF